MTWQWTVVAITFWLCVGMVLAGFLPRTTLWIHSRVVGIPAAAAKVRDAAIWVESKFK